MAKALYKLHIVIIIIINNIIIHLQSEKRHLSESESDTHGNHLLQKQQIYTREQTINI